MPLFGLGIGGSCWADLAASGVIWGLKEDLPGPPERAHRCWQQTWRMKILTKIAHFPWAIALQNRRIRTFLNPLLIFGGTTGDGVFDGPQAKFWVQTPSRACLGPPERGWLLSPSGPPKAGPCKLEKEAAQVALCPLSNQTLLSSILLVDF